VTAIANKQPAIASTNTNWQSSKINLPYRYNTVDQNLYLSNADFNLNPCRFECRLQ